MRASALFAAALLGSSAMAAPSSFSPVAHHHAKYDHLLSRHHHRMAHHVVRDGRQPLKTQNFTVAHGGEKILVTKANTMNGTVHNNRKQPSKSMGVSDSVTVEDTAQAGSLQLNLVNNFSGSQVNAYIQGLDSDGAVVFIAAGGTTVYPSSGGSVVPVEITQDIAIPLGAQGSTTTLTLPIVLTSGRVYFAEGDLTFYMVATAVGDGVVQPASQNIDGVNGDVNWGFMELTYTTAEAVYANISYVDFVGMILSMILTSTDGTNQTVQGLPADGATSICAELSAQTASDGWPWASECITDSAGELIRVLSPGGYQSTSAANTDAFNGYWSSYTDQVWDYYTTNVLTIDTQDPTYGKVTCQVSGDSMTCSGGDNLSYAKPVDEDIWGCNSGPFSTDGANELHLLIVPRLCAAFTRTTLLLGGGTTQPSLGDSSYYTTDPTHHFSKAVHDYETDKKGYAFSYDDVHPSNGTDSSGLLSSATPSSLTVFVGGMS